MKRLNATEKKDLLTCVKYLFVIILVLAAFVSQGLLLFFQDCFLLK